MNSSLYEQLGKQKRERLGSAPQAMEKSAVVADQLGQEEIAKRIRMTRQQMEQDNFNLMVLGRFSNGKSTALNALLGKVAFAKTISTSGEILPTCDLPTTAKLTRISYGERPAVFMWTMDGKREEWSFEKFKTESALRDVKEENSRVFANIREFEILIPADILQQGVTLMDSPGLDDEDPQTMITKEAMKKCDAAFIIYRTDILIADSEKKFINTEVRNGEGITYNFTIINRMNGRVVDERLKNFVWDRLQLGKEGDNYHGQDFSDYGVYFIDCYKAFEGVQTDNNDLIQTSGLALFTRDLTKFLMGERFQVHALRWIDRAIKSIAELKQIAERQQKSLTEDRERIEANYKLCLPKIKEIEGKRVTLENLFVNFSRQASLTTRTSYEEMINNLENSLESEMLEIPFDSIRTEGMGGIFDRIKTAFMAKQLAEESSSICQSVIKSHLENWKTKELQSAIQPIIEELKNEIQIEASQIQSKIQEIHMTMVDWKPDPISSESQGTSVVERLVWAALGISTGNVDWAIYGGALGWKGVLRGFLAEVGVGGALYALGALALGPAVLVGIIAGILTNVIGMILEADKKLDKIKRDTAQKIIRGDLQADPPLIPLRTQMREAIPDIEKSIQKYFYEMKIRVLEELNNVIREEEQEINSLLENSRRESQDRLVRIQELEKMMQSIELSETELKAALVTAKQG